LTQQETLLVDMLLKLHEVNFNRVGLCTSRITTTGMKTTQQTSMNDQKVGENFHANWEKWRVLWRHDFRTNFFL